MKYSGWLPNIQKKKKKWESKSAKNKFYEGKVLPPRKEGEPTQVSWPGRRCDGGEEGAKANEKSRGGHTYRTAQYRGGKRESVKGSEEKNQMRKN